MEPIKDYFERAVMEYSKGDVLQLLDARLTCAGPLLNIVMDGIDHLGGMCYGFGSPPGSKRRSADFMIDKMKLPRELADLLYTVVRCGIAHEGMPKIGVNFFVIYERFEPGRIFYNYEVDDNIWLSVVELAYLYLSTIERINNNWSGEIVHFPPSSLVNKEIFDAAKGIITDDVRSLAQKEYEYKRQNAVKAGLLERTSSHSAYTPENIFHFVHMP